MICDAHIHVGEWARLLDENDLAKIEPVYVSPKMLCAELKRQGVDEFIFSSTTVMKEDSTIDDLIFEAQEVKRIFGDGAHPFLWLSYRHWQQDKSLSLLDTTLFEGVKLHEKESHWVQSHSEELEDVLTSVEERGLPVQFHGGEDEGCHPFDLLPFAKRHPNIRFDFAHCRPAKDYERLFWEADNVFTDFCYWTEEEEIERLKMLGFSDRLLLGSDFPVMLRYSTKPFEELYAESRDFVLSVLTEDVINENFHRFLHGEQESEK